MVDRDHWGCRGVSGDRLRVQWKEGREYASERQLPTVSISSRSRMCVFHIAVPEVLDSRHALASGPFVLRVPPSGFSVLLISRVLRIYFHFIRIHHGFIKDRPYVARFVQGQEEEEEGFLEMLGSRVCPSPAVRSHIRGRENYRRSQVRVSEQAAPGSGQA